MNILNSMRMALLLAVVSPLVLACPLMTGKDKNNDTATALALIASESTSSSSTSTFALTGNWSDNWGGTATISVNGSTGTWVDYVGSRTILEYSMATGILYVSYPWVSTSTCNPTCYNYIEWIPVTTNKMYVCESGTNFASLSAAKTAAAATGGLADRSLAPGGGCGGFSWNIDTK